MSETKRFWLSFCDPTRPEGERFTGVAIVEVTAEDAARAAAVIEDRFPHAKPDTNWVGAAIQKAWRTGCNPGGEIAPIEIPPSAPPALWNAPLHRLFTKAELGQLKF